MEYFIDHEGKRQPIPDAIVSASEKRELVEQYIAASPEDREHLHQLAQEQLAGAEDAAAPAPIASAPLATAEPDHTDHTE